MARNDIRLDQINARLGDVNKPRERDYYDEDGNLEQFDGGDGRDDDGGSTVNAGFIATMVGLFLAVSGGTYMYSSGINPLNGTNISWGWQAGKGSVLAASSADGECGAGWASGYMNIDQMHCYMKTRISRLCNAKERDAFVARVLVFQQDFTTFQNKLLLATAQMAISTPLTDTMQLGIESAKMDNAKTPEAADKHMQNAMDLASGMMAGTNAVLKGQKYQHFGFGLLESDLRSLGENGYVSFDDFPSFPPKWVRSALADVQVNRPACK